MFAERFSVEINVRNRTGSFKAQKISVARCRLFHVHPQPIPAGPAIIMFAAMRVFPSPTVRQRNTLPPGFIHNGIGREIGCSPALAFLKFPLGIELDIDAGRGAYRHLRREKRCRTDEGSRPTASLT